MLQTKWSGLDCNDKAEEFSKQRHRVMPTPLQQPLSSRMWNCFHSICVFRQGLGHIACCRLCSTKTNRCQCSKAVFRAADQAHNKIADHRKFTPKVLTVSSNTVEYFLGTKGHCPNRSPSRSHSRSPSRFQEQWMACMGLWELQSRCYFPGATSCQCHCSRHGTKPQQKEAIFLSNTARALVVPSIRLGKMDIAKGTLSYRTSFFLG